jgi:hypothetical protein
VDLCQTSARAVREQLWFGLCMAKPLVCWAASGRRKQCGLCMHMCCMVMVHAGTVVCKRLGRCNYKLSPHWLRYQGNSPWGGHAMVYISVYMANTVHLHCYVCSATWQRSYKGPRPATQLC